MYTWRYVLAVLIFTIIATLIYSSCFAFQTEASYFTYESCIREGTSGIMADGRRLNNDMLICASWDYPFGTRLLVTNIHSGRSVEVIVSDRGPAKRLYRKGRKIDLSKLAFSRISELKKGIISVNVEVINEK